MASEVAGMPNGNYAPHAGYGQLEANNYAYNANATTTQPPPASSTPSNAQPTSQQPDISKDEVGWYFVEQYYTTLSRSPEKLYLFYNKRSQFVSGQETDKVPVCVGQRAINDKIRELDFHDCKVRVTNVDSQASDSNIVIQVIGEISNRGQPHKKFTQTFVLATQTNGYFVLNDIFRYLIEEEDEPEAETTAAAPAKEVQQVSGTESGYQEPATTAVEPETLTSSADPVAVEHDAREVDKEVEEKLLKPQTAQEVPSATVNGDAAHEDLSIKEEAPVTAVADNASAVELERSTTTEADVEPEKPKDPEPSPVASSPAPTPSQAPSQAPSAPKPAAPPAPKTWASLAASANRVTPATPQPAPTANRPAPAAPKPATPASSAASSTPSVPAQAAPSAPAAQRQENQGSDSQDEWTAVGSSHNRQQSRQTNVQPQEMPQFRGYIKNVHDHVDYNELKSALEKFGELVYLDIARQKNCAFVDFKTQEGYNNATAGPLELGEEKLYVEERRMRPGSTPYIPRGQWQGNRGGRGGAGGQGAPRGNFQANRGNATPRGRGNFQTQRGGRGGIQA